MVTLNKKDSERFLKRMIAKEKAPITKKEKKLAREVAEMEYLMENEAAPYVIKDGIITFTKPASYRVKELFRVLKAAKKMKKGQIMTRIVIELKGGKKR